MGDARHNHDETLATLVAAGVGGSTSDFDNPHCDAIDLVVDITAISGAGASLTATLQGKDPASGKYFTVLASAALTATGTTVLRVFPGATVAANLAVNDWLPRTWRVSWAIAGTTPSVTATIGAILRAAGSVA